MRTIDAIRLRTEVDKLQDKKIISPLTMKRMHTLIDSQPTVEADSGWIDCVDRLPDKNGHYTVTQERYSIADNSYVLTEVAHNVQFSVSENKWLRAKQLKVIAWREDPEPYKRKES